jgi:23S rRNA (adenine2503-C2)-methyltransferase
MRDVTPQLAQIDSAIPNPEGRPRTLFGLDAEALSALMVEAGEPAFRGRQLAEALYRQRIPSLDAITTLPKALRERLAAEGWQVGRPTIAQVFQSSDGTERYLVQLEDGQTVETVWMPEGDDGESGDESDADSSETLRTPSFPRTSRVGGHETQPANLSIPTKPGAPAPDFRTWEAKEPHRATICVSSQIGCAVNCQFCLTAKLGLQRNLTAGEIAGQVLAVFDRHSVEVGRDRVNLVFMGMGEPFFY